VPAPQPPTSGQNLFPLLFSNFVRKKPIKDDKKNMALLLVWDKDSYMGRFLVLFHAYMYYNPNWFISTSILHYTLLLFPYMWIFHMYSWLHWGIFLLFQFCWIFFMMKVCWILSNFFVHQLRW
jgi:hypothetical protein